MAKLDTKSLFTGIFGLSAAGATLGAIAGVVLGICATCLIGLPPILEWYRGQPEGWGIFTGSAAAIAFLVEAVLGAGIGAIAGALIGAGISLVASSILLSRKR